MSESEVVLRVELVNGPVARKGRVVGRWLRHLVLDIQGGVNAVLVLGGGNESLVRVLWIRGLVNGERVITRLGEGVDLRVPAISAVGPPRDRLAFLRRGSIEVGKGRSLELLLAKIGLDPRQPS